MPKLRASAVSSIASFLRINSMQEIEKLVTSILSRPASALAMGKDLFYRQLETGIEAAYQLAGQTMACNMIDEAAQEGVQAFMEKRAPKW